MLLNQTYAQYLNIIIEFQNRGMGLSDDKPINETERHQLQEIVQMLRASTTRAFIHYRTIYAVAEIEENKTLAELYGRIKKDYIIPLEDAESIVFNLNLALCHDIITNLLTDSQKIVRDIYDSSGKK